MPPGVAADVAEGSIMTRVEPRVCRNRDYQCAMCIVKEVSCGGDEFIVALNVLEHIEQQNHPVLGATRTRTSGYAGIGQLLDADRVVPRIHAFDFDVGPDVRSQRVCDEAVP